MSSNGICCSSRLQSESESERRWKAGQIPGPYHIAEKAMEQ